MCTSTSCIGSGVRMSTTPRNLFTLRLNIAVLSQGMDISDTIPFISYVKATSYNRTSLRDFGIYEAQVIHTSMVERAISDGLVSKSGDPEVLHYAICVSFYFTLNSAIIKGSFLISKSNIRLGPTGRFDPALGLILGWWGILHPLLLSINSNAGRLDISMELFL